MTTATSTPRTILHNQDWQCSASGNAIRTRYRRLHVSIWRRPQGGPLHFTVSGTFPPAVTGTREAIGYLWRRLLRHVAGEGVP